MMKHLRRDIKLCKIHANGQTAGQNTIFHKDWEEHGVWTFIYFNQPYWDVEWGGEFVCQTPDDEYHFTPYVPNSGVFIPSNWLHKGQPPNSLIGTISEQQLLSLFVILIFMIKLFHRLQENGIRN